MLCPHGSSYCDSRNIVENLVLTPYPHDRRCGTAIASSASFASFWDASGPSARARTSAACSAVTARVRARRATGEAEVMEAGGSCRFAVKTRWRQAMRRVRGD